MTSFEKTILVQYSANQMFKLVDDIETYPEFLPWCANAVILERTNADVKARLDINFHGVKQSFSTQNNTELRPELMEMKLVSGPFKHLYGKWEFIKLAENACKVNFSITYTFSNPLLAKMIGPVFKKITASLVDAFVKRADDLFG